MEGFICLKNVRSEYMPTMCNEMHIRIDNENSRVAPGDLFAYVALSAGQYFIGELHAEDTVAWQKFSALTGIQEQTLFTLHLGRANRRGYGRVTAWLQPLNADYDKRPHTWVQLKLRRRVSSIPSHESPVTLTLLTDTIVQDTWGRYALGFEDWLVNYLSQRQLPVTIQDIFVKQRLVDGFNGHLGLPRQRQVAIAAGSVAYLAQKPDTTWPDDWQTRLAQLEYDGIGLRRSEGFGQFAFNHPLYQRDRTIRRSAIRLQDLSEDLPLRSELATPFREIWERFLDEQTTALAELCKEPPFSAVARWLHSKQKESPATLKEQLLKLGEPSVCLLKGIKREEKSQSCTEQDEYGEREKRNRLIQKREHLSDPEKREQEALGILYMILERLEAESSTNWPMGIVMLADRLASVVDNEGDEK
jgi:CRISPR-associated protein Csx10